MAATFAHVGIALVVAAVVLRVAYLLAAAIFTITFRSGVAASVSPRSTVVAHQHPLGTRPRCSLHVVLGGCSAREEAACRLVAGERAAVAASPSASSTVGERTDATDLVWVLSPARKKSAYYAEYLNSRNLTNLRIACASVDTVTNFTLHASEIVSCVHDLGLSSDVLIFTCPQHAPRALAVARIVLLPFGITPVVVPLVGWPDPDRVCQACLPSDRNGQESFARTLRDCVRAVMWCVFRIDGARVAEVLRRQRHSTTRTDLDFCGATCGMPRPAQH